MTDRAAFLREIAANPASWGPRLMYADWLEDQRTVEDYEHAEFIRLGVEVAALPLPTLIVVAGNYYQFMHWKRNNPDLANRSRYVIQDNDLDGIHDAEFVFIGNWQEGELARKIWPNFHWWEKKLRHPLHSRLAALLTPGNRRKWTMEGLPDYLMWNGAPMGFGARVNALGDECTLGLDFRAGAVEVVTARFDEWKRHHKAIWEAHPIRNVKLTTTPALELIESSVHPTGDFAYIGGRIAGMTRRMRLPISLLNQTRSSEGIAELIAKGMDRLRLLLLVNELPGPNLESPIRYELSQVESTST